MNNSNFDQINLFLAAQKGQIPMMQGLIDRSVSRHERNREGNTLLHIASAYGQEEVVKWLLDKGADIHAKNQYGQYSFT